MIVATVQDKPEAGPMGVFSAIRLGLPIASNMAALRALRAFYDFVNNGDPCRLRATGYGTIARI